MRCCARGARLGSRASAPGRMNVGVCRDGAEKRVRRNDDRWQRDPSRSTHPSGLCLRLRPARRRRLLCKRRGRCRCRCSRCRCRRCGCRRGRRAASVGAVGSFGQVLRCGGRCSACAFKRRSVVVSCAGGGGALLRRHVRVVQLLQRRHSRDDAARRTEPRVKRKFNAKRNTPRSAQRRARAKRATRSRLHHGARHRLNSLRTGVCSLAQQHRGCRRARGRAARGSAAGAALQPGQPPRSCAGTAPAAPHIPPSRAAWRSCAPGRSESALRSACTRSRSCSRARTC